MNYKLIIIFFLVHSSCSVYAREFRNDITHVNIADLVQRAKSVLEGNYVEETKDHAAHTVPSKTLYPHTWAWDGCFIAIGLARYNVTRAIGELEAVIDGQWANGMIPHIVFDKQYDDYFPNWQFWNTTGAPNAPSKVATSGITQPPVLGIAMHALLRAVGCTWSDEECTTHADLHSGDMVSVVRFLKKGGFDAALAYHHWLRRERSSASGCTFLTHPWASGADNSPLFDSAMQAINVSEWRLPPYNRTDDKKPGVDPNDRPSNATYDRFVVLMACGSDNRWQQAPIGAHCPYRVIDPLFNGVVARDALMLADVADTLNRAQDGVWLRSHAHKVASCLENTLWDERTRVWTSVDERHGNRMQRDTLTSPALVALLAPLRNETMINAALRTLRSSAMCGTDADNHRGVPACFPLPTLARNDPRYRPALYWRGPTWINILWLLKHAVREHGTKDDYIRLRNAIVELCDGSQFGEYFDVRDGSSHGASLFSWSASLLIDTIYDDEALYERLKS